jgi:polysaccharide export outer membrane protein
MEKEFKIFITDDDVFSLNVHEQYLKNIHIHNISLFQNGMDCLSNLDKKPDIIFLDHNMDTMSGFEVLKKIKTTNPNIYVIMISAQENINTAVEALKCGAFDYIIKSDDVEKKIQLVIERIYQIQQKPLHEQGRNIN